MSRYFSETDSPPSASEPAALAGPAAGQGANIERPGHTSQEYRDLLRLFEQAPGFVCFFRGPEHVYELQNQAHHRLAQFKDIIGKPVRQALPELEGQGFFELLDKVFTTGQPYVGEALPLAIAPAEGGAAEQRYIDFVYQPIVDDNGSVVGIFSQGSDVTERILAQRRLQAKQAELEQVVEQRTRALAEAESALKLARELEGAKAHLQRLFQQAPSFIAILRGPEHVFDMVNDAYQLAAGMRDLLGKPIREAMPELAGQGFYELLDRVYTTGEPYLARGMPVQLQRKPGAPLEVLFINFVYQPITAEDGEITGVVIVGNDVTEQHLAQQDLARNLERLEQVERRQAFQLELADRIRDLAEPNEITMAGMETLGRRLQVDRVIYAEIKDDGQTFLIGREWLNRDVASVAGEIRSLDSFGPELIAELRAGRIVALDDAAADPRTAEYAQAYAAVGVVANLAVPLVKSGRLVAVMNVHLATPHHWTETSIDLSRETAERTWAALESARARAELKAERDQGQHILNNMMEGFVLLDREWRVLQINAEALAIGRRKEHDVLGRQYLEVWPEADARLDEVFRSVAQGGAPATLEYEHVFPDGGRVALEMRCHPWLAGGVAVFVRDITARQASEQALRDSEAKFRTITNAMPQMVFSTLPDGYHDYFNRQWHEYTGIPAGAAEGDRWAQAIHPQDKDGVWEKWRHSLATGEPYEDEFRVLHHSNEYRWVLVRVLPIGNDAGAIIRWMGAATDIHDQKLTQEALRLADRRKDEFLAMLAHELRNPLAPISAGADLLRLARADEQRVGQISELISRQVKHMTGLVDDLMDVSRVTRGLVTLDKTPLDARVIVADAVEQVRPLIDSRGHRLAVHTPPGALFVLGDKKRLIQVVSNLLNNAAKYTPQGGSIVLDVDSRPGEVVISVSDNGIGLGHDMVDRVFELFAQAARTSDRSQGGLGIGLALVKSLVELHGGRVAASSAGLNQGSQFTIHLPQVEMPRAPGETRSESLFSPAG
jgi:PAS domain S-box-containing protein